MIFRVSANILIDNNTTLYAAIIVEFSYLKLSKLVSTKEKGITRSFTKRDHMTYFGTITYFLGIKTIF
jgi:hypothetical protein